MSILDKKITFIMCKLYFMPLHDVYDFTLTESRDFMRFIVRSVNTNYYFDDFIESLYNKIPLVDSNFKVILNTLIEHLVEYRWLCVL